MRPRKVVRDDGKVYGSITAAAAELIDDGMRGDRIGVAANIRRVCAGNGLTAYGHRWRYIDGEYPEGEPEREPAGAYAIGNMALTTYEWRRFKRICKKRKKLMREAGAEAIRMWMEEPR